MMNKFDKLINTIKEGHLSSLDIPQSSEGLRGHGFMEVQENCYLVNFQVDNGCRHIMSNAVVFAINSDDAINKVQKFISNRDSESYVEKVFFCCEYNGSVFTDEFEWQ